MKRDINGGLKKAKYIKEQRKKMKMMKKKKKVTGWFFVWDSEVKSF